jgi:hypothetical protein
MGILPHAASQAVPRAALGDSQLQPLYEKLRGIIRANFLLFA